MEGDAMKVTIKDISKKTGISCSTISRVLTGNGYVKEETRDIVESAFAELGYKSSSKKRLANNLSQLVLVVVEDITNHFYAGFAPIAEGIVYVDAGAPYPSHPRQTQYRKLEREIWPRVENPHGL